MPNVNWRRQIDEHLGLGGPKPKLPTNWLAAELRQLAESERERSATNVLVLEDAAERLESLKIIVTGLAQYGRNLLEAFGAHVQADAYEAAFPDNDADAAYLRKQARFWRLKAREWAGEDVTNDAAEAAKERTPPTHASEGSKP